MWKKKFFPRHRNIFTQVTNILKIGSKRDQSETIIHHHVYHYPTNVSWFSNILHFNTFYPHNLQSCFHSFIHHLTKLSQMHPSLPRKNSHTVCFVEMKKQKHTKNTSSSFIFHLLASHAGFSSIFLLWNFCFNFFFCQQLELFWTINGNGIGDESEDTIQFYENRANLFWCVIVEK